MVYDIWLGYLGSRSSQCCGCGWLEGIASRHGFHGFMRCFSAPSTPISVDWVAATSCFYVILLKVSASNHGTVLVTVTLLYPLVSQVQDPLANLRLNWGCRLACFISPYVFFAKGSVVLVEFPYWSCCLFDTSWYSVSLRIFGTARMYIIIHIRMHIHKHIPYTYTVYIYIYDSIFL